MANVRATIDLNVVGSAISLNPALKIFLPNHNEAIAELVPDTRTSTSFINNYPPSYPSRNVNGIDSSSYFDDFYFKIRYLPNELDIGAITSAQSRELFVFNGFFERELLNGLSISNADGINVIGPATPTVYYPLALSQYTVSVTVDGPANIGSDITFDWQPPIEDATISITGTRIITYPYLFSPGTIESLTWATQVITSADGTEQRIRIRNAPRQGFQIDTFVPRSSLNIADNLLYGWRANMWGAPVFSEARTLTAPTSISSPVIEVNTSFTEFRQGELAVIYESDSVYEVIQIVSFDGSSITAAQNISRVFNTNSLVAPVIPCRMVSDPIRLTNGYQSRIQASFESVQNTRLSSAPPQQYLGIDVYVEHPLIAEQFSPTTYISRIDTIDATSSNVETFSSWNNIKLTRTTVVEMNGLEEIWNFKLWLHRRAGRLTPFWAPTYEVDFNFVNTGLVSAQLEVKNDLQQLLSSNRTHIVVRTKTNWFFSEITNYTVSGDNLLVNLSTPINVDASEILFISYLGQKRLTSDRIEIVHGANWTATCVLSITEVKP